MIESILSIDRGHRFWKDEGGERHRVDGLAVENRNGGLMESCIEKMVQRSNGQMELSSDIFMGKIIERMARQLNEQTEQRNGGFTEIVIEKMAQRGNRQMDIRNGGFIIIIITNHLVSGP
jgi:hypothetical protein